MNIIEILQQEFNIKSIYVENIIKLIDEGNTIPFIARYRKEMTGALDDQILREFFDRLNYIRNLEEKKEQTKNLIEEQGLLTDEIISSIDKATTITEIEDIYRPFRPKRRTRATIAKELGLEPLANIILAQDRDDNIEDIAKQYLNENIQTIEDAINGAKDIIAEIISDNADFRAIIRKEFIKKGLIVTKANKEVPSVYEMYYEFKEPVNKIADHRVLAINRGEKEKFLNVKIEEPVEDILKILQSKILKNNSKYIIDAIEDSSSKVKVLVHCLPPSSNSSFTAFK